MPKLFPGGRQYPAASDRPRNDRYILVHPAPGCAGRKKSTAFEHSDRRPVFDIFQTVGCDVRKQQIVGSVGVMRRHPKVHPGHQINTPFLDSKIF